MVVISEIDAKFFRQFFPSKKVALETLKAWGVTGANQTIDSLTEIITQRLYNSTVILEDAVNIVFDEESNEDKPVEVVEEKKATESIEVQRFSMRHMVERSFQKDSMRHFLNHLERFIDLREPTFVSMKGGKYSIYGDKVNQLFNLASACHAMKIKYYIVELPTSNFRFFLDIEDKTSSIVFDDHVLDYICERLSAIFKDIFFGYSDDQCDRLVCRNSKFWDYKLHVIFPKIVVNRQIYCEIISMLKDALNESISHCIDDQAKSLRILGASKPTEEKDGNIIYSSQKGVYLPDEQENNQSQYKVYPFDFKDNKILEFKDGVTPENLKRYSIRTEESATALKQTTIFYEYIQSLEKTSHIDDLIDDLTKDQLEEMLPSIVKMLKPFRSVSYNSWMNVGKTIHDVLGYNEDAVKLFQNFSSQSEAHKSSYMEECRKFLKNQDTANEKDDKNEYTKCVMKMAQKDNFNAFIELINYDPKQENKYRFSDYVRPIWSPRMEVDSVSKYVNPSIYERQTKALLVSSCMGSGKTTAIIDYLTRNPKLSFCWVVPRIAHGRGVYSSLCEKKIPVKLYSEIKGDILNPHIVIQYESLHKVKRYYDLMICDEIESIYNQAVSLETNSDNIDANIEKFEKLIISSKRVFFSDAFLSERTIKMMEFLNIDHTIIKYTSQNVQRKASIYGQVSDWEGSLKRSIKDGKRVYVFCGSLNFMEKLFQSFDSTTQQKIKKYSSRDGNIDMSNINEQWEKFQVVMVTSTITIGVDCQIPFDEMYCFHTNESSVYTRDVFQSLYRVRHLKEGGKVHFCLDDTYPNYVGRKKYLPLHRVGVMKFIQREIRDTKQLYQKYKLFEKYHSTSLEHIAVRFTIEKELEDQINRTMFVEMFEHYLNICGYHIDDIHQGQSPQTQEKKMMKFPPYSSIPSLTEEETKLMNSKRLVMSFENSMKVMKHHFDHYFKSTDMPEDKKEETFYKYAKDKVFRSKVSTFAKLRSSLSNERNFAGKSTHLALCHNKLRVLDLYKQIQEKFENGVTEESLEELFTQNKENLIKLNIKIPKSVNEGSKKKAKPALTSINQFLTKYTFQEITMNSKRVQENNVRSRVATYSFGGNELFEFLKRR